MDRSERETTSAAGTLSGWLGSWGPTIGLRRVQQPVAPADFEATAVLAQMDARGDSRPVLFERPSDQTGKFGEFRLLFNTYGTLASVAAALGTRAATWPEMHSEYSSKVRQLLPARTLEDGEEARIQRHVVTGDEVDLAILPWTRHVAREGGVYFTPIVSARAPDGSRYNLSWNRAMLLDGRHISVHISPKDLWGYHREQEERGEPLQVALVLGHHPTFNLAAAAIGDATTDEYDIAGALLGAPFRLAPSVSYGEEMLVPADAEVVVEGRLLPGTRTVEGPFGEYMRYLGPQKLSHVLEVDAITWSERPIVLEIFTCYADHLNAHLSLEASLYERARAAVPQVTGVSWFRGGGPTTLVIAMKKSSEGQPMRAAMAAMAAQNILKQVIVVDDDIDIEDSHAVLWAVSTRVRNDQDISVIPNIQGITLDPSGTGYDRTTALVIDATWPLHRAHPPVGLVPESAIERYPIEKYEFEEN